jgi:hypothetical protein
MFYKVARRTFCSGTPYHHDFTPGSLTSRSNVSLIMFDAARIFIYFYLGAKLTTHAFSFLAFRKTKFLNNPDYRLLDKQQYERIKSSVLDNK